ncbi:MAG TPA: hypothetical protein DIS94_11875 [Bacteroidetes bacterium]|nr:hypothetical protein [Bacteroidota bacterium]
MNILNITDELGIDDGVSTHVFKLKNGLDNQGFKNYILTGKIRNSISVNDVSESNLFHHIERSPANFIKAILFLNKFITDNNIKIINSHSHYAANIAKYASVLSKVKTVQTNHGLLSTPGKLKEFIADKIIMTNEHTSNRYQGENTVLIKHGMDFIPFDENKFISNTSSINILTSSRFVKEKNIEFFVHLASEYKNNSSISFSIAGEGIEKSNLQKLNDSLGGKVKFLGIVSDFKSLLSLSHIFIYPSLSENEGFPVTLLQAGMCSNLIITSDFLGLKNNFEDKKDGYIINVNDLKSAKELLDKITNDLIRYVPLAKNYHRRVSRDYSFDEMIEKHYKLYSSLI